MRAWLRDPLLWFAVAGVALFGGWQAFGHRENRIDLSAAAQAAMASDYAAMAGHQPGEAEKQKLIRREVDDEVLLAEGVRRGLHLSDRAIRERIIERMRMELAPTPPNRARMICWPLCRTCRGLCRRTGDQFRPDLFRAAPCRSGAGSGAIAGGAGCRGR
jgi:hypothetical protein